MSSPAAPPSKRSLPLRWVQALLALAFLNAMLSFDNWWPTPAIWPDARVAPEFIYVWALMLVIARLRPPLAASALPWIAVAYLLLIVGRYTDVTVPALLGRRVNLYWDGQQFVRLLWVSAKGLPLWQVAAVLLLASALFWGLYRLVRAALAVVQREAVPAALRSRALQGLTLAAVAVAVANLYGWRASWPYISKPVVPTFARQAQLLADALLPGRLERVLPRSPAFVSELRGLAGADVSVLMLESYGAVAFDHPSAQAALGASRAELERRIAAGGYRVVSAFVRAATFGGASDLSHLSLLSGVDLSDPMRHDLMLTSTRPTLISHFHAKGYQTVGLYPALSWDWDEQRFYGFDRFFDARDLNYRGPRLGYWWLPDQYAIARLEQLVPRAADSPPRFLFFPSITSHLPFHPVPPYQADWSRMLGEEPFDSADLQRALEQKIDWTHMLPAYLRMIDYNYRWVGGYLGLPRAREEVLVIVGDHQPAASVSGPGAPWDVPVHIVSRDATLLQRFVERGFRSGLTPQRPVLGGVHELTSWLLEAFDAPTRPPTAATASLAAPAAATQSR